jgi:2-oxoglutarate ferredoxin oxidoreductase subunit alpha
LKPESLEAHNWKLAKKYEEMATTECRHEEWNLDGQTDVLFVAYGTVARICKTAIDALREQGVKAGLFRPISLFPYPGEALVRAAEKAKHVLVSELSCGQMVEDVRYHLAGKRQVAFYGRVGGMIMSPEELVNEALKLVGPQG